MCSEENIYSIGSYLPQGSGNAVTAYTARHLYIYSSVVSYILCKATSAGSLHHRWHRCISCCVLRRNISSIGTFVSSIPPQPSSQAAQVVLLVLQLIAALRTRDKPVITVTNCSGLSYSRVESIVAHDPMFVITEMNFITRHSIHLIRSTHSVYIHFSSGGSHSFSSVGSPGGGWCTVCSHLAPAEVNFSLQWLSGTSGTKPDRVFCTGINIVTWFLIIYCTPPCIAQKMESRI